MTPPTQVSIERKARIHLAHAMRDKNVHIGYAGLLESDEPLKADWMQAIVDALSDILKNPVPEWYIHSAKQALPKHGGKGYWSGSEWVDEAGMKVYLDAERFASPLPTLPESIDNDARWMKR